MTIPVTVEQIVAAVESGELVGFCIKCGDEAYNVEPDARRYVCESCGQRGVYGAPQLLIMTVA